METVTVNCDICVSIDNENVKEWREPDRPDAGTDELKTWRCDSGRSEGRKRPNPGRRERMARKQRKLTENNNCELKLRECDSKVLNETGWPCKGYCDRWAHRKEREVNVQTQKPRVRSVSTQTEHTGPIEQLKDGIERIHL